MVGNPGPFDLIRNVHWASGKYAIICAEGPYATVIPDVSAKVIATHADPEITGVSGEPITATLLECSVTTNLKTFATINISEASPEAAQRVEGIVVPKSESANADWFNMYVKPISGERAIPTAPFLWLLLTMIVTAPRLIEFGIRRAPHLLPPPGDEPMVQMYPRLDPILEPVGATLMGYGVHVYRTDKKGMEQMFTAPPEWATDVIADVGVTTGLLFGKDPPLIAADIPYEP